MASGFLISFFTVSGTAASATSAGGSAGSESGGAGGTGGGATDSHRRTAAASAGAEGEVATGSQPWLVRQAAVELDVYGKRGLTLVQGEGARVLDAEGREYIDCVGGHGALNLGHRHPRLPRAEDPEALGAGEVHVQAGAAGPQVAAGAAQAVDAVVLPQVDRHVAIGIQPAGRVDDLQSADHMPQKF